MTQAVDRAGKDFWNTFWTHQEGRRFTALSYFHRRLSALLCKYAPPRSVVCEIGCGASTWLPLLAARGAQVWGIDYSDNGLALTRANLDRAGVNGRLIKGDVRDPGALPAGTFDMIFSLGLVEHFDDPARLLSTLSRSVRPGGIIVTLVPNFAGMWGPIQRWVDAELFAVHHVYTCDALDGIHERAGLEPVERARYFGGFGPLVVNYTALLKRLPVAVRSLLVRAAWVVQQLVASTLAALRMPDSRQFSSYLVAVYTRRPQRRTSNSFSDGR